MAVLMHDIWGLGMHFFCSFSSEHYYHRPAKNSPFQFPHHLFISENGGHLFFPRHTVPFI